MALDYAIVDAIVGGVVDASDEACNVALNVELVAVDYYWNTYTYTSCHLCCCGNYFPDFHFR